MYSNSRNEMFVFPKKKNLLDFNLSSLRTSGLKMQKKSNSLRELIKLNELKFNSQIYNNNLITYTFVPSYNFPSQTVRCQKNAKYLKFSELILTLFSNFLFLLGGF